MNAEPRTSLPGALAPLRAAIALLAGIVALLVVLPALAAGKVALKSNQVDESDGRWRLHMTINYGGTPHMAHVPMIFEFEMVTLYERALTDQSGDKPVLIRKPLVSQTTINESMDVGFSDAVGKVFSTTKFDFVLRRDRGFEAGEYTMKVRRVDDGALMGQPQKLTLRGDNPVVDRRAIVFSGEKNEKKKSPGADGAQGQTADGSDKPEASEAAPKGDPGAVGPDDSEVVAPPPVAPKQGGCGCRVQQGEGGAAFAVLAIGGLVAASTRRRRRRGAAPP